MHCEILVLYPVEELDTFDIMIKFPDPVLFAQLRKAGLPEMSVRDVAYIVPERDCFDEILVEPERAADSPGDLRDKLDVDDPMGDVIVVNEIKDLRLVDIPCVRPGVDDPVGIAGERSADVLRFPVMTAQGIIARCREGREKGFPLADV
jgi:hypothetical protein